MLAADDIVFTRGAYDAFVGGTASSSDRAVAFVAAPAAEATEVDEAPVEAEKKKPAEGRGRPRSRRPRPRRRPPTPPSRRSRSLPKGAKAPLKSGGAPKGYDVKGNADSGLYHEPDGQWYDQTEAEFYFKSADDAEAAGFTRAGGAAADDEEDDK